METEIKTNQSNGVSEDQWADFEMFEKETSSYNIIFKDRLVLCIRSVNGILTKHLVQVLKLKIGDRCLLSRKNSDWYFAVLPFDSLINGYRLNVLRKVVNEKTYESVMFSCKSSVRRGVPMGIFELGEPEFYREVDWYPLIKIAE